MFYQANGISAAVDAHNGVGYDYDTLDTQGDHCRLSLRFGRSP